MLVHTGNTHAGRSHRTELGHGRPNQWQGVHPCGDCCASRWLDNPAQQPGPGHTSGCQSSKSPVDGNRVTFHYWHLAALAMPRASLVAAGQWIPPPFINQTTDYTDFTDRNLHSVLIREICGLFLRRTKIGRCFFSIPNHLARARVTILTWTASRAAL